jgi:hypothetical protein
MAFQLSFERTYRVVRATASGVIGTHELVDLDKELVTLLAREEAANGPPIRGLFDFSEVTALTVPEAMAAQRGTRPAIVRGQRVMVPSRTTACSLVETFVQSQNSVGANQWVVVQSLDEAHSLLGLDTPCFEAIG